MQELNFKAGTVVNLDNTLYRILVQYFLTER